MAHASRSLRKTRRLKRERTQAFRLLDLMTKQRDMAREVAYHLGQELNKRDEAAHEAKAVQLAEDFETPVKVMNLG